MLNERDRTPSIRLIWEIWEDFQPYLKVIVVDFLISAHLYVATFIFQCLTRWLHIDGWAGEWIEDLHALGGVAAVGLFALLLVMDLWRIKSVE